MRLLKYISNIKSAAGLKFACSLYTFLVTEGLFSLRTLMLKKLAKKRREFRGATRSSGPESKMFIAFLVFLLFARP